MKPDDIELTEEDIARAKKRTRRLRRAGKGAAHMTQVLEDRQADYRKTFHKEHIS